MSKDMQYTTLVNNHEADTLSVLFLSLRLCPMHLLMASLHRSSPLGARSLALAAPGLKSTLRRISIF